MANNTKHDIWDYLAKARTRDSSRKTTSPTGRIIHSPSLQKALQGTAPIKAMLDDVPWNASFDNLNLCKEDQYYIFKEAEHTGRVVLGDPKALAYDKLIEFTDLLNKALRRRYPNLYYTTEDVYSVAKSHTQPWGAPQYIGYKDAFDNLSSSSEFWKIIGELGNYRQGSYPVLPSILIGDTERATGRTKKLAIEYCAKLLEEPNQWITICDHFDSTNANLALARQIKTLLVDGLHLKVEIYQSVNNNTGKPCVELKHCSLGAADKRNQTLCSPRTLSTHETLPKS